MRNIDAAEALDRAADGLIRSQWKLDWLADRLPEGRTLDVVEAARTALKRTQDLLKAEATELKRWPEVDEVRPQ